MAAEHIPYKNEHRVYTFTAFASEFPVGVSCLLIIDPKWVWRQKFALMIVHFNHYAVVSKAYANGNPV
jgi:hypothetical protein